MSKASSILFVLPFRYQATPCDRWTVPYGTSASIASRGKKIIALCVFINFQCFVAYINKQSIKSYNSAECNRLPITVQRTAEAYGCFKYCVTLKLQFYRQIFKSDSVYSSYTV